jgi:hypothetical protein
MAVIGPATGEEPVLRYPALPHGARVAFTVQVALEASMKPAGARSRQPEEAARRGLPDYSAVSAEQCERSTARGGLRRSPTRRSSWPRMNRRLSLGMPLSSTAARR